MCALDHYELCSVQRALAYLGPVFIRKYPITQLAKVHNYVSFTNFCESKKVEQLGDPSA